MFTNTFLKTTAIAATLSFVGASAQATTVASVDLTNGVYTFGVSTDEIDLGFTTISAPVGPALQITADFDASFMPFDLDLEQDFLFEAGLTIDDDEFFDDSLLLPGVSGIDILEEVFGFASTLPTELLDLIGDVLTEVLTNGTDTVPTELADDAFFEFEFDVEDGTDMSVQGTFIATLSSTPTSFFLDGPLAPGGTFEGYASISTLAPVPLPASSLIMLSGMAGFAALRRKKMASKA